MSRNHAKALIENEDSELVALCDVDQAILQGFVDDERVAEALDGAPPPPFFTDPAAMYRDAALDAVIIATPHTAHFAHASQALAAGCHIYLEKPMVTATADARELERQVTASDKVLVIGYNTPTKPAFQYLREQVRSGTFGRLELVNGFVSQDWKRKTTGMWRQDPALSGGGQAYDTGAHLLNSLVWTVESSPAQVFSFIDQQGTPVDVNSVITVNFASGVMASICVSGNCAAAGAFMTFIFEEGRIDIDGWNGEWINVYGTDGEEVEPQLAAGGGSPIGNFIDAVLGRAEPATNPRNGVNQSELMDAVYQSARDGRPAAPPA